MFAVGKKFGDWGWLSFGPRVGMSRYHIDMKMGFQLFDDITIADPLTRAGQALIDALPKTDANGTAMAAGGFVNFFVNWKFLYLGAELAAAYHSAKPMLLGKQESLGALQVQPSLLLLTRF